MASRFDSAGAGFHRLVRMVSGVATCIGLQLLSGFLPLQAGAQEPGATPGAAPQVHYFVLENGLRGVVVADPTEAMAAVRLVFPGGTTAVPSGSEGAGELLAAVLTRGTTRTSVEALDRRMADVGGALSAGVDRDFLHLTATVPPGAVLPALQLLTELARYPALPAPEIEAAGRDLRAALEARSLDPGLVASRVFARRMYGDHPYARAPSPGTVETLDRTDLLGLAARTLRPDHALLLVSGAVDPEAVEARAREALADWEPEPLPTGPVPPFPAPRETRIDLVHRPGADRSLILVGHRVPHDDAELVAALGVAAELLGGGPGGRLPRSLREGRGWEATARTTLSILRHAGTLQTLAEVPVEATDSAVVVLKEALRHLERDPAPESELGGVREGLALELEARSRSGSGLAGQVASALLAGRSPAGVEGDPERLRALTPSGLQEVARSHLRADALVIVVVGDAAGILGPLEALAPVTLLDRQGEPLDRALLPGPGDRSQAATDEPGVERAADARPWNGATLEEGIRRYAMQVEGREVGTAIHRLVREGEAWVSTTTTRLPGGGFQESELRFDAEGLSPMALRQPRSPGGLGVGIEVQVVEGRFHGRVELPPQLGGSRMVDAEVGDMLLPGMDEHALAATPLAEGLTLRIPYLDLLEGERTVLEARVTGRERVEVPAGTFESWRVEVPGPQGVVTLFLRVEAPHILVEQRFPPGQPVTLVLTGTSPL